VGPGRGEDFRRGQVPALDAENQAGAGESGLPGDAEVQAFKAIGRRAPQGLPSLPDCSARAARLSTTAEFRTVKA